MMESLTLRAALRELLDLKDRSVSAVRSSPDESAITIHFAPTNEGIVLDMTAGRPGLYRTGVPENSLAGSKRGGAGVGPAEDGGRMTALAGLAEEKLRGARAISFEQKGLDRVAILTFARRDRFGDPLPLTVVVELFGAWGNIIVIEGDVTAGRILDRLRLDNRREGPRALGRGRAYEPPATTRVDITREGDEPLRTRLSGMPLPDSAKGWADRLRDAAEGVSPFTAAEVVHRAGDPLDAETLCLSLRSFVEEADAGGPVYGWRGPSGAVRVLTFEPRVHPGEINECATVAAAFATRRDSPPAVTAGDPKRELRDHLESRKADALRLLDRLRAEEKRRPEGPADRRRAEALLAWPARVPRGAAEVLLPDPGGDGEIRIELDPSRSAVENAERFFHEARKADQAALRLPKKIASTETQISKIEALIEKLEGIGTGDDRALARLKDDVFVKPGGSSRSRATGSAGAGPEKPDGIPAAIRPRRYDLPGGWVILVGRSNTGNDYLTHHLAAPHDLWFHVHGASGSHVVLKAPDRRAEPDRSVIMAAAALAALNSKARHSSRVPVIYAEKRHVRKPRGGKPGLAAVTHEKSVMVKPAEPKVESTE